MKIPVSGERIAGFTLVELCVVISSNHVFNDDAARDKARQLADNAISSFIFSDNYEAYQQALGVFVSEDDHEDTREQGAPIVISGGTLKKYSTESCLFSYVLRDNDAKTLSLCSETGAVIASLSYNSDAALNAAVSGNDRLNSADMRAVLSNMKYNATNMTNGTLKAATDPNAPGKYNIVLKLDILPVVTYAYRVYWISQELPDITLYYNSTDGKFYRKENGSFISYTFDGYSRLIGTYPGFEEDTGVSSLPEGCRYEKGQRSEILQKCIDLIKDNLNGGSISYSVGPVRYD